VFGNLTVHENLMVPYFASARTRGTAEGVARAEELLKLSTLAPLTHQLAKSLSGGQRMLLQACAGFMIPAVQVHVLDEPFAGINPVVKDTLIELILHENRQQGAAFLIVSHEMEIIRRICPRVTVMIAGRVAAEGSLDEIARREDVITAYLGRSFQ
jgi:branched-chain amino acid transport system ATP-binding protein